MPVDNKEKTLVVEKKKGGNLMGRIGGLNEEQLKKREWTLEQWQKEEIKSIEDFPLKKKEIDFLKTYIEVGGSVVRTYMKVYPKAKEGTARTEGSSILSKPYIKRALQFLLAESCSKESVVAKFDELRSQEQSKEIQFKANEALAKMHSLFVDRVVERNTETIQIMIPDRHVVDIKTE